MSNTGWTYLLVAGCAWLWLAARLDRLGKQLEAVSHLVRQEMAELVGNEDRAKELLEEWTQDQAEEKKDKRRFLDHMGRYWRRGTCLVVVHRRPALALECGRRGRGRAH
jgi:hypothetical protein